MGLSPPVTAVALPVTFRLPFWASITTWPLPELGRVTVPNTRSEFLLTVSGEEMFRLAVAVTDVPFSVAKAGAAAATAASAAIAGMARANFDIKSNSGSGASRIGSGTRGGITLLPMYRQVPRQRN